MNLQYLSPDNSVRGIMAKISKMKSDDNHEQSLKIINNASNEMDLHHLFLGGKTIHTVFKARIVFCTGLHQTTKT
jgi:hypothetical protein